MYSTDEQKKKHRDRWVNERKKGIDDTIKLMQECLGVTEQEAMEQFAVPMEELDGMSFAELVINGNSQRAADFLRGAKKFRDEASE